MEHGFSTFVRAVIDGDVGATSRLLRTHPEFATEHFEAGATRLDAATFFYEDIAHYCYRGDTRCTWPPPHSSVQPPGSWCEREPVRTRSAMAVRALLAGGADVHAKDKNGSSPLALAVRTTGRGGSGSVRARQQQTEIIAILGEAGASPRRQAVGKRPE